MNNQQGNRNRQHGKQEKKLKEVYLPYQFIPFSEDEDGPRYFVPYNREIDEGSDSKGLPRHDCPTGLTGTIEYEIQPELPLALEIRKVWKNDDKDEELLHDYFLSGSQIRGLVRSNAETLSHSVPEFVNKQHLLFRNFTDREVRKDYIKKLQTIAETQETDISKIVRAGFLTKEGNRFYVIPAQKFKHDIYFKKMKEHKLLSKEFPSNYRLIDWDDKLKKLTEREEEIDKLTEIVKKYNINRNKFKRIFFQFGYQSFKANYKKNKNQIEISDDENLFISYKDITYKKIIESDKKYLFLKQQRKVLMKRLKAVITKSRELRDYEEDFLELYTIRWMLKIERAIFYEELTRNKNFTPYEWKLPSHNQYIYSSSHTQNKNTHYKINGPSSVNEKILEVPDHLINQYNEYMSRLRFPIISAGETASEEDKMRSRNLEKKYMDFYNLFNEKVGWNKEKNEDRKKIVFYLTDKSNQIVAIGRTPYLKIPVNHSITDLLYPSGTESRLQTNLDYARAMFGFVADKSEGSHNRSVSAYKSRVIFEPVRIMDKHNRLDNSKREDEFLLLSPLVSADGMYLKQLSDKKHRYSSSNPEDKPSLRGRKYYLIRTDTVSKTTISVSDESQIHQSKYVYGKDTLELKGKIHFHGLSPDELGLLLLSVDIGLITEIRNEFEKEFQHIHPIIKSRLYELIGGAKPYGYGKVTMKIKQLQVEPSDISFESLMGWNDTSDRSDYMIKDAIKAFLDKIITEFETDYLQSETFQHYLLSKTEFDTSGIKEFYEWTNLKVDERGNKGGYDTKWILGTRDVHPG